MSEIAAYTHSAPSDQEPDTKPGSYYVSVRDNGCFGLLLGPFPNDHQAALDHVAQGRQLAEEVDPRAAFFSFGTCRMPEDYTKPGHLNDLLK